MVIGGEMEDCTNVIINRNDTLEKRKGFVRAMEERFNGVVCGLFKYTDHCGVEHLLVADEAMISIRQPFAVPVFEIADCYPFDAFSLAVGQPLDSANWRNRSRYEHDGDGNCVLAAAAAVLASSNDNLLPDRTARWFKDSCSRNYQVRLTFAFDEAAAGRQRIWLVVRGNSDLTTGALIMAIVDFEAGGVFYEVRIVTVTADRQFKLQSKSVIVGDAAGTFTLAYNQATGIATATVDPDAGSPVEVTSAALTSIQDADLGLISGFGLGVTAAAAAPAVAVIDGGPL